MRPDGAYGGVLAGTQSRRSAPLPCPVVQVLLEDSLLVGDSLLGGLCVPAP